MARPNNPAPSYLLHRKSGQARVRLKNGSRYRDVYLGEYGSPESCEKYRSVVAEQSQAGTCQPQGQGDHERGGHQVSDTELSLDGRHNRTRAEDGPNTAQMLNKLSCPKITP
jgi:hypothetical protein